MATAEHPLAAVTVTKEMTLLDQIAAEASARYMPTLTVKQFTEREKNLRELKEMLVEGVDYGVIPGTDKPVLLLPGAQKICTFFGYAPHYELACIEDWNGSSYGEPLFYYKYTCVLSKGGNPVGEGQGSCNSWESKYRYRWVKAEDIPARYSQEEVDAFTVREGSIFEFDFAVKKSETSGKYGKSLDYWQRFHDAIEATRARHVERDTKNGKKWGWEIDATLYRIPNDQFADIINTCQKMGQKRAYVAATLSATGASQYFTQDLEDTTESLDQVRDRRIAEERSKTSAAEADSPELAAVLAKLTGKWDDDQIIIGDLAQGLDELQSGEGDKAFVRAQKEFGRPDRSAENVAQIVRYMFNTLKKAEAVAHA